MLRDLLLKKVVGLGCELVVRSPPEVTFHGISFYVVSQSYSDPAREEPLTATGVLTWVWTHFLRVAAGLPLGNTALLSGAGYSGGWGLPPRAGCLQ